MYMGSNASPNNLCSQPREEDDDNDGMKENLHRCKHTQEKKEQWPAAAGGQLIKLWPLWSETLVRALNASILLACHS